MTITACTPFSILNKSVVPYRVVTVASWPAYRFLGRQVIVWYSHLFKSFPQIVVIYTVKGFSVVSETEADFFGNSLAFSMIQQMLAIWSLVPLLFLNPGWTSGSSWVHIMLKLSLEDLNITLLEWEMSAIVWFNHSLELPILGIWVRIDLFQSCGHCWVFQICWHIECSTSLASSFRILNSSAGIPSLPQTVFFAC